MQSKKQSVVESVTNTVTGFLISLLLVNIVLPYYGFNLHFFQSVKITLIFSLASIGRGYLVRRVFNKKASK